MVAAEAVKRTNKKAQEGAIRRQVNGNFFIYLFCTRSNKCYSNLTFIFECATKVNFLLVTTLFKKNKTINYHDVFSIMNSKMPLSCYLRSWLYTFFLY